MWSEEGRTLPSLQVLQPLTGFRQAHLTPSVWIRTEDGLHLGTCPAKGSRNRPVWVCTSPPLLPPRPIASPSSSCLGCQYCDMCQACCPQPGDLPRSSEAEGGTFRKLLWAGLFRLQDSWHLRGLWVHIVPLTC